MKKIFCIVLLLIAAMSCSEKKIDFERAEITINNQKFELLTAYALFEEYIDKKSDYQRKIFNHIKTEFKKDAEYLFILESIKRPIKPDEELQTEIELLKLINFTAISGKYLDTITKMLSGPDTKILFIPSNPEYRAFFKKYNIGVTAVTVGSGKIIVSVDPTSDNWEKLLPYVLAHEYHHSVWTSKNFSTIDFTPLEYLVLEGRADVFASELFPAISIPWTNMIDKHTERRVWGIIKPELNQRKSDMNDKMMIGTKEIPFGSGYTIGFNIVQSFKANKSNMSDSVLIDIDPSEILISSDYEQSLPGVME
ncbi:MAG: DUF2268 domain-containing putative Zn-dependent protease [Calditrichaceae bacterium]